MYSRRDILHSNAYAHVFFRCHNQQFFLKRKETKDFLICLWAKYKAKYSIKIFDFIIMDNHAHLVVQALSAEHLGHFMRTVNSQLALFINDQFNRDSQALRERYKSPMITNNKYLIKTIEYVWLNRYCVDKTCRPERDPYCSAAWRVNPHLKSGIASSDKMKDLLDGLLDRYSKLPVEIDDSSKSILDMLNAAISRMGDLCAKIFENSHTISDGRDVNFRASLLSACVKERIPWFG